MALRAENVVIVVLVADTLEATVLEEVLRCILISSAFGVDVGASGSIGLGEGNSPWIEG